MKSTKTLITSSILGLAILSGPALAQDAPRDLAPEAGLLMGDGPEGDRNRGDRRGRRGDMRAMFRMMDVNMDRQVSREEFMILPTEQFKSIDKDGDGIATTAEIDAIASERAQQMRDRMVERLDTNKDGSITLEEFQSAAEERFSRLDRNNDGVLARADMRGRDGGKHKRRDRRDN